MTVTVVASPKGGVGKSTLSTNIAGYFASSGAPTVLGDLDPQQSSRAWLGFRPANLPSIGTWAIDAGVPEVPEAGVAHAVLDTPAGLTEDQMATVLSVADRIVVPLQPSIFDIYATQVFLQSLVKEQAKRRRRAQIGVIGMRVDARTRSAEQLQRFVAGLPVPVLGYLRDTQNYIQLAAHGLTLWDVSRSRVERDLEQWQPIIEWLEG